MKDEIPKAGIRDWLGLYLGRSIGIRVDGDSMSPTLVSGEKVLVNKRTSYGKGDIVLVRHPFRRSVQIIKRLVEFSPDGNIHLRGDNPDQSHDSRGFGSISPASVIGKVVAKVSTDA